jgi:AraC-like DNA-binding protein
MVNTSQVQLLDAFPLSRARTVAEASERIGRTFSPHRLELRGDARALDVHHNQVRMRSVTINTLRYGTDVFIDPGERGDFYMVQLPLSGKSVLMNGREETGLDPEVLSVLQPRARCRMLWGRDCSMILVQVPADALQRRAAQWGIDTPRFPTSRSRRDPAVAAWWQAALDLTCNLDRYGQQWQRHAAAFDAMEDFLLCALTSMLGEPTAVDRVDDRCVRRAKEYIHAHLHRAVTLSEIASHACVSPRTLEVAFKRSGELSPLAYARRQRMTSVHRALHAAAREGRGVSITDIAMAHGFMHMSRFASQYREQFGCAPSETLRLH